MKVRKITKKTVCDYSNEVEDTIKTVDKIEKIIGYIPTGCTLLNLALSDKVDGGFGMGKIANIIGDSSSGKSLLALSIFAECAHNSKFDDYRLIYDEPEQACEFDIERLFGKITYKRIESPFVDEDGMPICSETIQDFHANIHRCLESERPFIYILDSLDALDAEEDQKKALEIIRARERGTKVAGTYGMAKPKTMSWILRNIVGKIKRTKSALIIISQTRDNINPISFAKKTRSGGRALKFYCSHELWMVVEKSVKKLNREIGIYTRIKITKNKLTGKKEDTISIPIYRSYGVDDIGASVDFLVREKHWETKGQKIDAKELGLLVSRRKLIREIEQNNLKKDLDVVVEKVWREIEEKLKLNRKPKYV